VVSEVLEEEELMMTVVVVDRMCIMEHDRWTFRHYQVRGRAVVA
jgi:hypothetical protein